MIHGKSFTTKSSHKRSAHPDNTKEIMDFASIGHAVLNLINPRSVLGHQ